MSPYETQVTFYEARVTIYHNGRKVGTADNMGSSLKDLAWAISCDLENGEVGTVTRYGEKLLSEPPC